VVNIADPEKISRVNGHAHDESAAARVTTIKTDVTNAKNERQGSIANVEQKYPTTQMKKKQ
jgi:hypothetical protein